MRLRSQITSLTPTSYDTFERCARAYYCRELLGIPASDAAPPNDQGLLVHDMLWRVLRANYEVIYEPEAIAYHEHRREQHAIFAQLAGHQRGLVAFLTKAVATSRGRQRLEVLAFMLWRLLKPGVRLALRAAGRDPLPARALLLMWAGALAGGPTYLRLRRETGKNTDRALVTVNSE